MDQGIPTWHPQTLESPSPARWLGTRGYRLESAFTGGNGKTLVPDLRRDLGDALPSSSLPLSQPRVLYHSDLEIPLPRATASG